MMRETINGFFGERRQILAGLFFFCLVASVGPAAADIYMYKDADGVMHFTNTPTSSRYRVYLRSKATPYSSTADTFDDFIEEAAMHHGVDFPLIKAVIRAESGFNHRAVSKKGAQGLMQIMPFNFKTLKLSDPYNPRENIMAGTRYLRWMLDRFDGKVGLSLAAYNCGPTVVERYQCVPPIDETLDYVEKVLRYYRQYQARR
ncbi:MAG: lytic transglycosylase domain-containing protein [Desulfobacterales bacterium]|jgi:soluble lytic murein transglycosylase